MITRRYAGIVAIVMTLLMLALWLPTTPALAAAGTFTLSQTTGTPRTYVAIVGTGWTSVGTTSVTVSFDSSVIAISIPVASGNFNSALTVPNVTRGPHSISVTSNLTETFSSVFTVTPLVIGSATTAKVGDQVAITGNGFAASSAVSIFLDALLVAPSTTDSNGTFGPVPISIPETPAGDHTLNASDLSGLATPGGLSISPKLTVSGTGAAVGGQLTISGKGYAAVSPLTVTLDTAPIAANILTNAAGSFASAAITVPAIAAGTHTLKVQDNLGNNATAGLSISSVLKIEPAAGAVGSSASVTGSGYLPNTSIILTYNGIPIQSNPASILTGATGNFSASFMVPATAAGTFGVIASDGTNTANSTFKASAAGSLATVKGSVGDSVQVTGSGFTAGAAISIRYDNALIATAQADAGGVLSASITVPPSQAGEHKISASDSSSNSVTFVFSISPSAKASATSGAVGSATTIQGTGFIGGSAITLQFDGVQAAKSTADPFGGFSIALTVPTSSAGAHKIAVSDGANSISLNFNVIASASSSTAGGAVGSAIQISGTAFRSAGTVSIKFDESVVANTAADADGTFKVTFKAPAARSGNHIISASDGTTTKSFNFAIDAAAPPAPALVFPASASKADSLASFEWTPVTDANAGINYTFQLASDANFSLLLVNQSGLSSPTYKLIEAQKLKNTGGDAPYFWRVKATDAASNESPWSTPLTFRVGFQMPTYLWYVIGAFIAILTLLGGLYIGRKTARR